MAADPPLTAPSATTLVPRPIVPTAPTIPPAMPMGRATATTPTIRWDSPSAGTAADMAAVTTGTMATGNTTATVVGAKAVTAVGVTGGIRATAARTAAGSMVIMAAIRAGRTVGTWAAVSG